MIESAIIKQLQTDAELATILSTYDLEPAIFAQEAPEDAEFPYIIIRLERSSAGMRVVNVFNLYVDYLDNQKSRADCNQAQERIEFSLSQKILNHERYSTIRVWSFSGSYISEPDPRMIHYNQQFYIRATRKKWMAQL